RACRSVGCDPLFVRRAAGCLITDVDGNEFIDFVGSWGPMILGHAHPEVVEAIQRTAADGTSFGAPSPLEVELADMVCRSVPSLEKVRFVSSGTEATMSAVRLARGYTGRKVVVKSDGCYHGHADTFLVRAGSVVITLGIPGSPGVPEDIVKNTLSIPYNDTVTLERTLRDESLDIACVIVEPVAGNMGVVPPDEDFLQTLRRITRELGIVLIFDEVITGFRLALGGAQERFGITPDLTCLGKIIGGGLPVGAYGGRAEIMDRVAPDGPVYQAGTLSGNPLAMAAGLAMLKVVRRPGFYEELEEKSDWFAAEMTGILARVGVPTVLNRVGSMMTCFFTTDLVRDYESALRADTDRYGRYFRAMLDGGVWLAPSQFEAAFISAAHGRDHLEKALAVTESSFKKLMV
ncbi:MAG: glutamate-1-semialdehyde 2,1-aminomutase, partial [Desulfobulbaceae bacterium]|nr:glutamate-1-semialdehyde 2,1-aminomutase [Desulfobulbaceae bacterium]